MNNKEFLTGLSLQWKKSAADTKKWVDRFIRVLGECFEDGSPVAIDGLGVFVIIKHRERIVTDKQKRMLVPPKMELNMLAPERLPDINALTVNDLSKMLAESDRTDQKAEENRIKSFVDVLLHSVDSDLVVKINRLGAFKAVSTKEIHSLDADTGQTVVNTVHDELSFTPDKTMRDLVNRPFAQFVPVQLNEGVVFDDMDTEYQPEMLLGPQKPPAVVVEDDAAPEEPAEPEQHPVVETADSEENPQPIEAPKVAAMAEMPQPTPTAEDVPEPTSEKPEEVTVPDSPTMENGAANGRKRLWWLLPLTVAVVSAFILLWPEKEEPTQQATETESVAVQTDSITSQPQLDLEALNSQYPYGAYEITGIDTTVVVRPGETLEWISKVRIGAGLEPYIKIINGGIETIKEGDTLLIPKLQLKKQFRK